MGQVRTEQAGVVRGKREKVDLSVLPCSRSGAWEGTFSIQEILEESIAFYNTQRPHQGIRQHIPKPGEAERTRAPIRKSAVLG